MPTTDETPNTDKIPTPRRSRTARRPYPERPIFTTELEERAWVAEQEKRAREYDEAAAKYPPGSTLFVSTARGIPQRRRAGISFSDKGRQEVEVIDLTDDELEKIKAGDDSILGTEGEGDDVRPVKQAVRIRSGAAIVTPLGAKAIAEDDGLAVWSARGADPKASDEKDARIAELEAQLAAANKTIASLRKGARSADNPAAPSRLKGDSDFGGDPKADSKAGPKSG